MHDPTDLLRRAAATPAFTDRLKRLGTGKSVPIFDHVASPAQSFIAALILAHLSDKTRIWVLCDDLRVQERVHAELAMWWQPHPLRFFPQLEFASFGEVLPDPDLLAERLTILHELNEDQKSSPQLATIVLRKSLDEDVPSSKYLREREFTFAVKDRIDPQEFGQKLDDAGYERAIQVTEHGQYALRGGIIDIFSLQSPVPVRIELFDDEIESIREFEIDTQASFQRIDSCRIMLGAPKERLCKLADYIKKTDFVLSIEGEETELTPRADARILENTAFADAPEDHSAACYESPLGSFEAGDFILQQARRETFIKQLHSWNDDDWPVTMFFNNEGEIERFKELINIAAPGRKNPEVKSLLGTLSRGFLIPGAGIVVLSDAELFGRYQQTKARRLFNREKRNQARRAQHDFRELNEDDLVVHLDYGVARYQGLIEMDDDGKKEEVLVLEYADQAKLYVPLEQAHLVSRYVGAGKKAPPLNKLGGGRWTKTKAAAEKAIMDYAAQLLRVHAERETFAAYQHPPDNKWQQEFEASFIYKETPDQLIAIHDTKVDMESAQPMDRLICGDVGFGKTEVAIRAAFKAVMGGKQVAFLAPTTVLAHQHFKTLRERMSDYPITIEGLSRFRTTKEQKDVVKRLAKGEVDIVIGTHRLISKDIKFKNVGLVIIDEEQRFGVIHKERFKDMFRLVDVLTLSATPIPRTLYLSLMGVKDMSTIETAPVNRHPVNTTIAPYDERLIRSAIQRELDRKGQVYFLHNRVQSIENIKEKIEHMCPGARVSVGHGQMEEGVLEVVMDNFIRGNIDVLVCTTIIESGIDIPNANTIVIDRADRFGLADLYQLRGRVGRAEHRAYALLMLPREMMTTGDARKRINAIKQYSALGAGFKIAMRDLEIRGAGNLLGTQQSGHILAIGFDLYCKLLKQSVERLQGSSSGDRLDVSLDIDFLCTNEAKYMKQGGDDLLPAYIPARYMHEARLRIAAYRDVAEISTKKELNALIKNWRDRFGKFPPPVNHLLRCADLKIAASIAGLSVVEIQKEKLMLIRNGDYILINGKFPRISGRNPDTRFQNALDMVKRF
jgi:transcription-repair coupling factor (superfamily II helicase)